ncbi:MAG TPA: DNA polymerase/3'-5' exonuclease PolX [Thermoanaerobaculia bacterium]|jgi:DNA polymerase (family 10)|nr:DNA polymerase/3'-5' exonuclease PolX [Thermoanaerobaculia bacterium]
MDKFNIARTLDEISRYIQLSDPNPFKAKAFEKAARAVENLEGDFDALVASGAIYDTEGIGKATGKVIEEIANSGASQYLEELRAQFPAGIFELLRIPKLGLKKIGQLYTELGIGSLDELEEATRGGKVAKLKGFGTKTAEVIMKGIGFARMRQSSFLLPVGIEAGELLRERLAAMEEVDDVEVSGSVRRRFEVIHNVNLVVSTRKPAAVAKELQTLVADLEEIDEKTFKGTTRGEMDVFFHLTTPAEFGTTVFRTTGNAEFVEAFEEIAGAIAKAKTEREIFTKTGIPFVEPERRETPEDLKVRKRTKLVEVTHLLGTFHVHTTFSDGRNTVGQMLSAANDRGWEYVGISDHSPLAYYAGGLSEERLKQQHAEIAREEKNFAPMRVFRGTEADILQNGAIDYGDKILSKLDFVIASIHSGFTMSKDEMTERILTAMDDPYVTFLGHLTGRRLLSREGYSVEYERIFEKAGQRGVMIEINGNPQRLDLDWRHIRRALDLGVLFSINPDAHSINEYNAVITGTWVARKGGLGPKQIFNTRGVEEVAEWFAAKKLGAAHG